MGSRPNSPVKQQNQYGWSGVVTGRIQIGRTQSEVTVIGNFKYPQKERVNHCIFVKLLLLQHAIHFLQSAYLNGLSSSGHQMKAFHRLFYLEVFMTRFQGKVFNGRNWLSTERFYPGRRNTQTTTSIFTFSLVRSLRFSKYNTVMTEKWELFDGIK